MGDAGGRGWTGWLDGPGKVGEGLCALESVAVGRWRRVGRWRADGECGSVSGAGVLSLYGGEYESDVSVWGVGRIGGSEGSLGVLETDPAAEMVPQSAVGVGSGG